MSTVLFDLNGTLLDPAILAGPLGGGEQDEALVRSAFDLAVVAAMVATVLGRPEPFSTLIERALRQRLLVAGRSDDAVGEALELTSRMPPYPGAAEALDVLLDAGHRPAVVTNSAWRSAETALRNAGLLERFVAVTGADEVGAYKPDARVYHAALDRLDATAPETWLVAAHWWDVLGARRAGLRTAWVGHKEKVLLEGVEPDVAGEGLLETARALVAADPGA